MKKQSLIKSMALISFLGLVVILAGCGGQKNDELMNSATSKSINKKTIQKEKGLVSGIKNALQSGKTMKCVMGSDELQGTTYIKGKNVKTRVRVGDKFVNTIVKDGNTYTWMDGSATGQKMTKKCMEDMDKAFGAEVDKQQNNNLDEEEIVKKAEAGEFVCEPAEGVQFDVPKNVKFVDQCQAMKGITEKMQKQSKSMGQNTTGNIPNTEELKDMQKQMQKNMNMPVMSK